MTNLRNIISYWYKWGGVSLSILNNINSEQIKIPQSMYYDMVGVKFKSKKMTKI